jgi:DNA-binding transcriptional MerR regulator
MATAVQVDIPDRALFKAAEVCDLIKIQPYVLKSWEAEFPDLGITKAAGAPRVYRRADVEQAARIKHLLLVEGLTLAGARRKLEEESAPVGADAPVIDELLGRNARERLTTIKRGLRSILELLEESNGASVGVGAQARVRHAAPYVRAAGIDRDRDKASKARKGKPAAGRNSSRKTKRHK